MAKETDSKLLDENSRKNASNAYFREDVPPPHEEKIEKAILGAMLLEEEARNIAIEKLTSPSAFYYPAHQRIFKAILKLFDRRRPNTSCIG